MKFLGWDSQFIFCHGQGLIDAYVAEDSVDFFVSSHSDAVVVESGQCRHL